MIRSLQPRRTRWSWKLTRSRTAPNPSPRRRRRASDLYGHLRDHPRRRLLRRGGDFGRRGVRVPPEAQLSRTSGPDIQTGGSLDGLELSQKVADRGAHIEVIVASGARVPAEGELLGTQASSRSRSPWRLSSKCCGNTSQTERESGLDLNALLLSQSRSASGWLGFETHTPLSKIGCSSATPAP